MTAIAEKPMTDQQRQVLDWITVCRRVKGFCPTVREVQRGLGYASPNAVHGHLWRLRRKGVLTWEVGQNRTLREVPHG